MVKYVSVIYRPPGSDRKEVVDYWLKVHAPLVKKLLPELRKYTISFPLPSPTTGEVPDYDGIVELYFDDYESMRNALRSPSWQSDERKASSIRVIDYTRLKGYFVEVSEIPV